jgi:hypothetical protein
LDGGGTPTAYSRYNSTGSEIEAEQKKNCFILHGVNDPIY